MTYIIADNRRRQNGLTGQLAFLFWRPSTESASRYQGKRAPIESLPCQGQCYSRGVYRYPPTTPLSRRRMPLYPTRTWGPARGRLGQYNISMHRSITFAIGLHNVELADRLYPATSRVVPEVPEMGKAGEIVKDIAHTDNVLPTG